MKTRNGILLILGLLAAATPAAALAVEDGAEAASENRQRDELARLPVAVPADGGPDERAAIYERVEVRERADDLTGVTVAASEGLTGHLDLRSRPIARAGALLETVPGLIATQHSGGGKANQYFLRGFNLDHGTDFSVTVAGVPVNMPSHGHGQGYADLSFVIPELVERVTYRKGTYYADTGDFSAAGAVDMRMVRDLESGLVRVGGGELGFGRVLLANSFNRGGGDLTAAIDLSSYDGPWRRAEELRQVRALLSFHGGDSARGYSWTAMAYSGDWLSTDQIPRREVEAGRIGRFDLIDPGPRGASDRYSLSAELHRGGRRWLSSLAGYLVSYEFGLISNFTYRLDDPELGDQFEQVDDRVVVGLAGRYERLSRLGGRELESRAGFDLRWDDIDNGLFRTSDLERVATVREDAIGQLGAGLWAETTLRWNDALRATLGLRAAYYAVNVESDLAANSGRAQDLLLSPNLSLVLSPAGRTEWFLNLGWGYHSNDARGATIRVDPVSRERVDRVEPLVAARGAELGVRTSRRGWTTSVVVFGLELDSELIFVGDGGATEASRPSGRLGVEWANFFQIHPRLAVDADLTWTDAEFTDSRAVGSEIPGTIGRTIAAGVTVKDLGRLSGSLRWRYFADIPLTEDGSVERSSSSLVNASATIVLPSSLEIRLDVFNLLDRDDSDVEYFYASRLPGEPPGGVEDLHFHPVEGRNARIALAWRF